jgi:phospholipid/cholesterol/gamma-HCH transport system ATP-binding protein
MADTAQTPVEVHDLRKSFGAQQVLKGISLSVPHGQTVAVLGRSGGGKSVLRRVLIGLQPADSGSVKIDGTDISGLAERPLNEIRKKMGFVFQEAALYDSLTVEQNVDFPLSRHAALPDDKRRNKVRELRQNAGIDLGRNAEARGTRACAGTRSGNSAAR